jgi:hypothetical protein
LHLVVVQVEEWMKDGHLVPEMDNLVDLVVDLVDIIKMEQTQVE